MKTAKVALFGSPQFAASIFEKLIQEHFNISLIVTQKDKKSGRGQEINCCPAAQLAKKYQIPLWQPEKIVAESAEFFKYQIDYIICAAYGKMIPDIILNSVKVPLNIHGSILPKYRGAAPIHYAILNNEKETGISLMHMVKQMDAGKVYAVAKTEITPTDDIFSLEQKLIDLSIPLLLQELPAILNFTNLGTIQDEQQVTYAPPINKEDGKIIFNDKAITIFNKVRAFKKWPVAYSLYNNQVLKIYQVEILDEKSAECPGMICKLNNRYPVVATQDFNIKLLAVQLPGKKIISGADFVNGNRNAVGSILL